MRLRDREFVLDLGIEVRDRLEEEQGLQGCVIEEELAHKDSQAGVFDSSVSHLRQAKPTEKHGNLMSKMKPYVTVGQESLFCSTMTWCVDEQLPGCCVVMIF